MTEIDDKADRLARVAHASDVGGVVITLQPNFAWLTGGQSNRIDGSSEAGAGSLCVSTKGTRYLIANNIEMPRLRDEALPGLEFEPVEYPWTRDHEEGSAVAALAAKVVGGRVGADAALAGARDLSADILRAHTPLTAAEMDRYRVLGRDVGHAVGELCRTLQPGMREDQIARGVQQALATVSARPVVLLVGSDDRIATFRHPVPTDATWTGTLMIGVCAERHGLVVALSRMMSAGRVTPALAHKTNATAHVFARLLGATRAGATGSELFQVATGAYRDAGFMGQESLHHQGGAIGYRSRDWIAHPRSSEVVRDRQAFAWNPSITGTKIEETALLIDERIELITTTPGWPVVPDVDEHFAAPGIYTL